MTNISHIPFIILFQLKAEIDPKVIVRLAGVCTKLRKLLKPRLPPTVMESYMSRVLQPWKEHINKNKEYFSQLSGLDRQNFHFSIYLESLTNIEKCDYCKKYELYRSLQEEEDMFNHNFIDNSCYDVIDVDIRREVLENMKSVYKEPFNKYWCGCRPHTSLDMQWKSLQRLIPLYQEVMEVEGKFVGKTFYWDTPKVNHLEDMPDFDYVDEIALDYYERPCKILSY